MAMSSSGSLREQLCQIEQSLGVCHVADVQVWPNIGRPADLRSRNQSVRSALAGSGRRPPMTPGTATSRGGGFNGHTEVVHQPQPPPSRTAQGSPDALRSAGDTMPSPFGEQDRKLDMAVAQVMEGKQLFFGESDVEVAGLPKVVALGERDSKAATLMHCAPRLPQQLADIRMQLRELAQNCDNLQAMVEEQDSESQIESVEAEHASAMGQAARLLEALGASTTVPGTASHVAWRPPGA
ncbi:unnamed protein product [Polarella glacialis]|uniref:Uncharacterized protein n=1 Tax=Polarella glacialis TaxID=89957 RepID=A0A813HEQ2_POLGL|nr:unnamed protein product [Polarella glacialis]